MSTFVLQTPIDESIMIKVKKEAKRVGFRSVQELVNLFLTKVANDGLSINLGFEEKLSKKAEDRLIDIQNEVEKEMASGTVKTHTSSNDIMKDLLK